MKKIFYSIFAATTMLVVASCSQDEELVSGSNGNEEMVTFAVNTGIVTRAAGDGNTVNKVHYEVWDKNTGKLVISTIPTSGAMTQARAEGVTGGQARVSMSLVKGVPYDITFWAQNEEGTAYDISKGLDEITMKGGLVSNKEAYDAFFKTVEDFKVKNGSTTVELKRPFAQVNIGTAPADWQRAIDLGVKIDKSTVTVSGVHNLFNARTSDATGKASVTFAYNALLNETFEVKDSTYQYLAMNYLLADSAKSLHNLDVTFKDGDQEINSISIANMPIQRNWRTNIVGRLLTSDEDFVIIIDEEFDNDHNISEIIVNNDEELDSILRQDIDGDLIINLGKNAETRAVVESPKTYNVKISAWNPPYYFGGEKTNSITINANGNIINFIHNNTDWNYIRCTNDACKWYINDAHLTNSGANNGPWNRHDIRFYNAVELNNVTSDKAIALLDDGKLTNVTISDMRASDDYGLWITAEGQTVELDGCTFDMVKSEGMGRGIKIADEYISEPAKVTISVKNTKFNTQKKAAVLVTSKAGAVINWGAGNDISGVAADKVNAVWVDNGNGYKNIEDVTATGCSVVIEGEVLASGVVLADGVYQISSADGLRWLATQVNTEGNTFNGKTVILTADIDLQGMTWTPIGLNADASNKFCGIFDGQEHTVKNLSVNQAAAYQAAGLFGALNGTVQNFTVKNATIKAVSSGDPTDNGIAVVAGSLYNKGNVYNVHVEGATVNGNRYVGGIAGYAYGNIKNCSVTDVTLIATPDKLTTDSYNNGDKVGGIAGYYSSESTFDFTGNVVTNVNITGYRDMGIMAGLANNPGKVYGNTVEGKNTITVNREYYYGDKDVNAGEIVGRLTNGSLGDNNVVNGSVEIIRLTSPAEVDELIKNGEDYTFTDDVKGEVINSNGYGKTGINQLNGGTIDGDGKSLSVNGANGTWDTAINTTGGTIKNLTIDKGFRGIFVNHNSEHSEKVILENVIIDGTTYTISCDQGTNNGLEATGCTINGWTSYAATLGDAKFTGCRFGEGNDYAFCRPFAPTEFVDCDFEAGYTMDPRAAVTFENCRLDGVAITADNLSTLVTSNIANATLK